MSVAPLHAIRASTAGTGKSYLIDLASVIATGRPCPVVAAGRTEEETEKRLVGLVLAGYPIISIDNVNDELGGDLLCQIVERPLVRVRPLGQSDIVELESRATMTATGNGLRVRGDMTRRTLIGDLDANMERPELRLFAFDPMQQVLSNRGEYVAAVLTIVMAYLAAGQPNAPGPLASFEDWSGTVRGSLLWLECADPTLSMEAARDDDPELRDLREILLLWKSDIGLGARVTVSELVQKAEERKEDARGDLSEFARTELRDALLRIAGERHAISTRRLGKWLPRHEGRIVDGLRLKRAGIAHSGPLMWTVDASPGR